MVVRSAEAASETYRPGRGFRRQAGTLPGIETEGEGTKPHVVAPPAIESGAEATHGRLPRFGLFAIGFLAVSVAAVAAWPLLPRRFEAPASIVLLVDQNTEPGSSARPAPGPPDDNVTQSEVDLISSPALAKVVVAENDLLNDPEFTAPSGILSAIGAAVPRLAPLLPAPRPITEAVVRARLQARLKVVRDRRSYTVVFGYWSNDPRKAAVLSTSLLHAYLAMLESRKREGVRHTTGWLDERVAILDREFLRADAAVHSFLETSGLIDVGAQASLDRQLETLSTELAQTRSRTIEAEARAAMLRSMAAAKTIDSAPDVLASPAVQKLKEARAEALAKPGVFAPEAQVIGEQIASESGRIVTGASAEAQEWRERLALLQAELQNLRAEMMKRARAKLRLEALEREAKVTKSVLEDSRLRLANQTSLVRAVTPDVEIMAQPEPALNPAFPNPVLGVIGTILAASLSGVFLACRSWLVAKALA